MNRQLAHALVLSSNAKRFCFNLLSNLAKVGETAVCMEELAVFSYGGRRRGRGMDKLENKGTPSNDALATGKKVASDDADYGV